MFELEKTFRFEASHLLPNHDGKCRRLHGHSWVGKVVVAGGELCQIGAKQGMVVDYGDIKEVVQSFVDKYLDHWHLNDKLAPFGITNPTSEEIAKWLFDQLRPFLPQLVAVVIEETCTSRCTYRPVCTK